MPEQLRIPRYLSVVVSGSDVLVGLLPPRAVRIRDAPEYLPALLGFLSAPRSREEVATYGASLCGGELVGVGDAVAAVGGLEQSALDLAPERIATTVVANVGSLSSSNRLAIGASGLPPQSTEARPVAAASAIPATPSHSF